MDTLLLLRTGDAAAAVSFGAIFASLFFALMVSGGPSVAMRFRFARAPIQSV